MDITLFLLISIDITSGVYANLKLERGMTMKIKEAAAITGLAERTIRFYEEEGLFEPRKKYSNGRYYRDYSDDDIRDLKTLATLRRAGFTMDEIRRMQNEDDVIGPILTDLGLRLERQKGSAEAMAKIIGSVTGADKMDIYQLSDRITSGIETAHAPDIQLRFGRMDGVDDAQRAAEYERFAKRRDRKRPNMAAVLAVIFGVLALLLSFALAYVIMEQRYTVPPAAGLTADWEYRVDMEEGSGLLEIYGKKDGAEKLIYSQETASAYANFNYFVGSSHLYIYLEDRLFSLNADGSGYHRIYSKSGSTAVILGEFGQNLVFYGPSGYGKSLMYVPIEGGRVKKLLNGINGQVTVTNDTVFALVSGRGYYAVDLYSLEKQALGRRDQQLNDIINDYFQEVEP